MRLGALLLTAIPLAAQSVLPWDGSSELPWLSTPYGPPPAVMAPGEAPDSPPRHVTLTGDGTLRISNAKGRILLRMGLPGRPVRILRDAGTPMTLQDFPAEFPSVTPLSEGKSPLPLAGDDFRGALTGLLWILDDGGRRITVVHPATCRLAYIPLPEGEDWELQLRPDRLEVCQKAEVAGRQETVCWSVPWLLLLPSFVSLSLPPPVVDQGTAFHPFPAP